MLTLKRLVQKLGKVFRYKFGGFGFAQPPAVQTNSIRDVRWLSIIQSIFGNVDTTK
jgi:hypothetical protein